MSLVAAAKRKRAVVDMEYISIIIYITCVCVYIYIFIPKEGLAQLLLDRSRALTCHYTKTDPFGAISAQKKVADFQWNKMTVY